jgi:hypothetical protein
MYAARLRNCSQVLASSMRCPASFFPMRQANHASESSSRGCTIWHRFDSGFEVKAGLSAQKTIRQPCRCPYGFVYGPAYGTSCPARVTSSLPSEHVMCWCQCRQQFAGTAGHFVAANGVGKITGATPVFVAVSRHKYLFLAPIVAAGVAPVILTSPLPFST